MTDAYADLGGTKVNSDLQRPGWHECTQDCKLRAVPVDPAVIVRVRLPAVACPWCGAAAGAPCVRPSRRGRRPLPRTHQHPSRREVAA